MRFSITAAATSALLLTLALAAADCTFPGSSSSSSSSDNTTTGNGSGSGSGSGGTFSASDINGSWNVNCTSGGSGASGFSGGSWYTLALQLTGGGNFNLQQQWFSTSNCANGTLVAAYGVGGTYTVGGVISSSSSLQSIQFTISSASSGMTVYTNAAQTSANASCTPSNSFNAAGNGGVGEASSFNVVCGGIGVTLPNSTTTVVNNVVGFTTGALSLGSFSLGIPGVFASGTTPTTTSLSFH